MKFSMSSFLVASLLFSNFYIAFADNNFPYNIYYQEIQDAKKNDTYLKKRKEDIDHPVTKALLNQVDIIKQMEEKDKMLSIFGKLKKNVFLNNLNDILPYIVPLNESQIPKLFDTVKKLSDKLNISMPLVFLFDDETFFNAMAFSITSNFSAIFIGEKLLKALSKEEFEAVIAHELSHIEKNHVLKTIATLMITGPACLIGGIVLGNAINKQYLNNNFLSGLALRFSFVFSLSLIVLYLILKISKRFEKQADITALKVLDDPNSIISLMETFEEMVDKKFEKEIEFLKERIKFEISEKHPDEAEAIGKTADRSLWWDQFARRLMSTHPTSKERKEYLKEELERMNLEKPAVSA